MACLLALAAEAIRSTRAPDAVRAELHDCGLQQASPRVLRVPGHAWTLQPTGWIDKEPSPWLDGPQSN